MTAALRSNTSSRRFPPRQPGTYAKGSKVAQFNSAIERRQEQSQLQSVSSSSVSRQTIQSFPASQSNPLWLRVLAVAQRTSTVLTFFLVASTLAVYGWTVYSQQLWGKEYQRLEALQRQERQLTAANEVLKDQIAQEAEAPESGLAMPDPTNAIFLQPAPPAQPAIPQPAPAPEPAQSAPLGY